MCQYLYRYISNHGGLNTTSSLIAMAMSLTCRPSGVVSFNRETGDYDAGVAGRARPDLNCARFSAYHRTSGSPTSPAPRWQDRGDGQRFDGEIEGGLKDGFWPVLAPGPLGILQMVEAEFEGCGLRPVGFSVGPPVILHP